MAAASTVPAMGTRVLVRPVTLPASMPLEAGELPEPATSQPNRGQSSPNAMAARRDAGRVAAMKAAHAVKTAAAAKPVLNMRRIRWVSREHRYRRHTGIFTLKVDRTPRSVQARARQRAAKA